MGIESKKLWVCNSCLLTVFFLENTAYLRNFVKCFFAIGSKIHTVYSYMCVRKIKEDFCSTLICFVSHIVYNPNAVLF